MSRPLESHGNVEAATAEFGNNPVDPTEQYFHEANEAIEASALVAKHNKSLPRLASESPVMRRWHSAFDGLTEQIIADSVGQDTKSVSLDKDAVRKSMTSHVTKPPKNVSQKYFEGRAPDYAFPMFPLQTNLAKLAGKDTPSAPALAKRAEETANNTLFSDVKAVESFVNLRLADGPLIEGVQSIIESGDNYGRLADHAGEVAIIDYSGPNLAKPFGINHLRSTVIGESLARLMDATGYTVVRDNHLGDWGTNIGNLLAAHDTYSPDTDFTSLSIDQLKELYVQFNAAAQDDEALVQKGRDFRALLGGGDPKLIAYWASARQRSLDNLGPIYERLGIHFDTQIGERYFVEPSIKLVNELIEQLPDKVIKGETGSSVRIKGQMKDGEETDRVILMTENGYSAYGARDLATIKMRADIYDPAVILYVVGDEQTNVFESVFEVANDAGLNKRPDGSKAKLEHITFGLLMGEDGRKLSTRAGNNGRLEDILEALDEHSFKELMERNTTKMTEEEARVVARKISSAALIWNNLQTVRKSNIRFDFDRMLKLGNQNVIDVLYSYVRTSSILDRVEAEGVNLDAEAALEYSNEAEHQLAVRLNEFSDIVQKAAEERAPHLLAGYLRDLSHLHGNFYEDSPIIRGPAREDASLARMRVDLHRAYRIVVANGLNLLNIPIVERL